MLLEPLAFTNDEKGRGNSKWTNMFTEFDGAHVMNVPITTAHKANR